MKRRISWKKLWEDFDNWFENTQWRHEGDWECQQKKIQRLVNKQLKEII